MQTIQNFNGLRFILAVLVIYAHVTQNQIAGKYAVAVFFILSGFLFGLKHAQSRRMYGVGNVFRSMGKLYPAHILMLVLFVVLAVVVMHKDVSTVAISFVAHALFVQTWVPLSWFELLNSPSWFLATYFGILFMFCIYTRYKALLIFDILLCVVVSSAGIVGDVSWWYFNSPYMRFFDFMVAYYAGQLCVRYNGIVSVSVGYVLWGLLLMVVVLTVLVRVQFWEVLPDSVKYSFIYLPSGLLAIYVLYRTEYTPLWFCRFLKCSFLQFGGGN